MSLFRKEKKEPELQFPPEDYEPVLRCSICTGEQVACMRERATGRLHEVMLIRMPGDLEAFCRKVGAKPDELKKIY